MEIRKALVWPGDKRRASITASFDSRQQQEFTREFEIYSTVLLYYENMLMTWGKKKGNQRISSCTDAGCLFTQWRPLGERRLFGRGCLFIFFLQ